MHVEKRTHQMSSLWDLQMNLTAHQKKSWAIQQIADGTTWPSLDTL